MHEAGAREIDAVIREGEKWIRGNPNIANRGVRSESKSGRVGG